MATTRVLIAAIVLTVLVNGGPGSAQDDDTPLRPSTGPYRGVVVDDRTGRPLPSAAVIILWQRLDDQIQGLRRLSGAREVFTNEHGEFVHDVAGVEGRLPPRTFAPRIVTIRIPTEKIRDVIGPGGKTIRMIIEKTGGKIDA